MTVAPNTEQTQTGWIFNYAKQKRFSSNILYFFFLTIAAALVQRIVPTETDWVKCFRPATLNLITGHNPHLLSGCNHMTWALVPLIPLATLPTWLGQALLSAIGFTTFRVAAIRFGATRFGLLAYLFNFFLIYQIFIDPNVDWLVVLGLLLPPKIGVFGVLVKPQVGMGVAMLWAVEAWEKGKLKQIITLFAPVVGVFLLTLLLYGNYVMNFSDLIANKKPWTLTIWPYSIPIGIGLLYYAIKRRSVRYALLGMPWLSPYVGYYTWPVAMLGLFPKFPRVVIFISVTIWLIMIVGTGIIRL